MSAESLHAPADGTAAPARVRIARRALAPAHITRHRPGGMIYREVRAALPAMAILACVAALGSFLVVLESRFPGGFTTFRYERATGCPALTDVWRVLTVVVFLVAGVLCGAEEAENGTSDLTYRLPVRPARIFVEKTAGALLAVGIWIALSWVLSGMVLACGLGTDTKWADLPEILGPCWSSVWVALLPGLLFFFWGQAAGAWSNHVLAGAIGGGSIAMVIYFASSKVLMMGGSWENARQVASQGMLLAASTLGLALASARFRAREGR